MTPLALETAPMTIHITITNDTLTIDLADGRSLVVFADLLVSAGGTMNREAAVLGTPVWSIFEGRLGAVDEALLREGRLRKLEDPDQIEISRRPANAGLRVRRDPRQLVTMLLAARES